jgi:hypothetical protein
MSCRRKIEMTPGAQSREDTPVGGGHEQCGDIPVVIARIVVDQVLTQTREILHIPYPDQIAQALCLDKVVVGNLVKLSGSIRAGTSRPPERRLIHFVRRAPQHLDAMIFQILQGNTAMRSSRDNHTPFRAVPPYRRQIVTSLSVRDNVIAAGSCG